jgi:hypothetical protein
VHRGAIGHEIRRVCRGRRTHRGAGAERDGGADARSWCCAFDDVAQPPTTAMPAPRSNRAGNVSASGPRWRPDPARASEAGPGIAPTSSSVGSPERSASAAPPAPGHRRRACRAPRRVRRVRRRPTPAPSAGRIRVATRPAGPRPRRGGVAAHIGGAVLVRTHADTAPATAAMSDCRGASYAPWPVACSPRRHHPEPARPGVVGRGGRCRARAEGASVSQPDGRHPRVAVGGGAVPSNKVSTGRIAAPVQRGDECISDVPGLAKHTSTPRPDEGAGKACAPFTVLRAPGLPIVCSTTQYRSVSFTRVAAGRRRRRCEGEGEPMSGTRPGPVDAERSPGSPGRPGVHVPVTRRRGGPRPQRDARTRWRQQHVTSTAACRRRRCRVQACLGEAWTVRTLQATPVPSGSPSAIRRPRRSAVSRYALQRRLLLARSVAGSEVDGIVPPRYCRATNGRNGGLTVPNRCPCCAAALPWLLLAGGRHARRPTSGRSCWPGGISDWADGKLAHC